MIKSLIAVTLALALHCSTVIYRHKDSVESPIDKAVVSNVIMFWAHRGICIEAAYIFPDPNNPPYNDYEFIKTGEQDPYFTRDN